MFGSQSHKNEGKESMKKRGNFLFIILLVAFGLSFWSCEGQTPKKPIKIDVTTKPNNNGVGLGVKRDTIYITKFDTIYKEVPFEVIKTVEVIKEVKVPEPYPVEVIKEVEVIKTVEVPVEVIKEVIKEVPYEVIKEVTVIKEVEKGITVDTLQTLSDIVLLDFTDSAIQPSDKADVYAIIHGVGLAEIKMDTIYNWQRAYNLKRTKSYGTVSYESFGLPFQVRENYLWKITSTSARLDIGITKKQSSIKCYLNTQIVKTFTPGTSEKIDDINYRFYFEYPNLTPNTEYEAYVEIKSVDGEITFSEPIKFKTLP